MISLQLRRLKTPAIGTYTDTASFMKRDSGILMTQLYSKYLDNPGQTPIAGLLTSIKLLKFTVGRVHREIPERTWPKPSNFMGVTTRCCFTIVYGHPISWLKKMKKSRWIDDPPPIACVFPATPLEPPPWIFGQWPLQGAAGRWQKDGEKLGEICGITPNHGWFES